MSFCTVINCMDGRVQLPVIEYLKAVNKVKYVDSITEPGPVQYLSTSDLSGIKDSILRRVDISVEKHSSNCIAVMAHADCAGNPVADSVQKEQLETAFEFLQKKYPQQKIMALWLNVDMQVQQVL